MSFRLEVVPAGRGRREIVAYEDGKVVARAVVATRAQLREMVDRLTELYS